MKPRAATPDDAAAIADIYAPFVTGTAVSFEMEPPDAEAMRARIEAGGALYPWLVGEAVDGTLLGYAYAARFRQRPAYRFTVETSVYLRLDAGGKGLGRRLYEPLLAMLEGQGFTQAIAAITLPNEASVRLHERLGFERAGTYRQVGWKFGAWHDVGLWQRRLAAAATPPAEPTSFVIPDLIGNP
ncbi:MAG TPA: arsinothricin resistance N-acetyltransferase ArsN1 family B [Allosphingosinicella sp.]|jgi:phosphinothricin acetyltransferase